MQQELKKFIHAFKSLQKREVKIEAKAWSHCSWVVTAYWREWVLPHLLKIDGSLIATMSTGLASYALSFRLHALFCQRALCIDLTMRRPSHLSCGIVPLGSGLRIKHVVPETSQFMVACKEGNASAVWHLLHSKKGSVNDITPTNSSAMRVGANIPCVSSS